MRILSGYPNHTDGFADAIAQAVPGAVLTCLSPNDAGFAEAWAETEVFIGWPKFGEDRPELSPDRAANLRWVQATSAGIASIKGYAPEHWLLTTASGVFGPTLAEHALAMMLHFERHLHRSAAAQRRRTWGIGPATFRELSGLRLLALGFGDIGQNVATRAVALGLRVTGLRREASEPPVGVERVVGLADLDAALAEADVVVASLPGTRHTRGLLDARRLALMPPDAGLVNVGRGSLIDHDALAAQLRDRPASYAGLDVTHPEPLPSDHPLWDCPNALISPHIAGGSEKHPRRVEALFLENLRAFAAGRPEAMRSVFDPHWEY
ncbi:MAG: D-2-hydroxyacid dehydrogenase [Planctomycetota bacterium]